MSSAGERPSLAASAVRLLDAYRDVHADEAGRARQERADGKAYCRFPVQEVEDHEEENDADYADGRVLAFQVGRGTFLDGLTDGAHCLVPSGLASSQRIDQAP